MTKCFLIFILTATALLGTAQEEQCRTVFTEKQKAILGDFGQHLPARNRTLASTPREVGIVAHLLRRDDGTGGLTTTQLTAAIDVVNTYYANANLHFFVAQVDEVNSTRYFDFDTSYEQEVGSANDYRNVINIYFVNSISDSLGSYCGYAYFPGGPDRILMDNGCAINGSTLAHEIGHYFTLIHTHGNGATSVTDELVNGSNCNTAGDELCDTPADPRLGTHNVNASCTYVGTATDTNGDKFVPDPRNIMSYSRKECRNEFSSGQYTRMDAAYDTYRSYLIDKPVAAYFESNIQSLCTGLSVAYTEGSVGATGWSWHFPGGEPAVSSERNPTVRYDAVGNYDVQLIVTGTSGQADTLILPNYVSVTTPPESDWIATKNGFELESGYSVGNRDGGISFQRTNAVSKTGTYSMFMNFFNYENVGEEDYLQLPYLDNTFSRVHSLRFDYAYAYYQMGKTSYTDGLAIVYKADCDTEWKTIWSASGTDLATTTPKTDAFVPGSAHWRTMDIAFTLPEDISVYELAFKTTNGYGNNLYLDNIEVVSMFDVSYQQTSCVGAGDGMIEARVSGSTPVEYTLDGINFNSSGIFTGLSGGAYEVTVRDSAGRSLSQSIHLAESYLEVDLTHPSCAANDDGAISFEVIGDSGVYEFEINGAVINGTSVSGLTAGTYELLARKEENGCEYVSTQELVEPVPIQVNYTLSGFQCAGDEGVITFSNTGGSGSVVYTVNGEPMGTAIETTITEPGNYLISASDGRGCEYEDSVEFAYVYATPEIPEIRQVNDQLQIDPTAFEITWYLDGERVEGADNASIDYQPGTYQVSLSNLGGICEVFSEDYVVLGVDNDYYSQIVIAPNPVKDELMVQVPGALKQEIVQVSVFTLSGKLVHRGSQLQFPADWQAGVYLVQVKLKGRMVVRRMIKQ